MPSKLADRVGIAMSMRPKAVSGLKWSALDMFSHQLLSALIFFLLARLLAPEAFGVVAIALAIMMLTEPIVLLGLGTAIVQRPSIGRAHLDAAFWVCAGSGLVVSLTLFSISGMLAEQLRMPELAPVIQWIALSPILKALASVQIALLRRDLQFKALAIRSLIAVTAGGSAGVWMAFQGFGAYSLVANHLIHATVSLVLIWWFSRWLPRFRFSRRHASQLWHFSKHVLGFELVGVYNRYTPQIFVGFFLGAGAAGYFAIAERVLRLVLMVVTQSLNQVALSVFSRLHSQPEQRLTAFYRAVGAIAFIGFPVIAGLVVTAPHFVPLLLGEHWLDSVLLIQILLVAGVSSSLTFLNGGMLTALGVPGRRLLAVTVRAVVGTVLFTTLHVWGVIGIAVAFLFRNLASDPVMFWLTRRALPGFRISAYWRQLSGAVATTGVMVLVVVTATAIIAPLIDDTRIMLLVQVMTGMLSYTAATALLNRRVALGLAGALRR